MSMSRKHFEAFARIVRDVNHGAYGSADKQEGIRIAARDIAHGIAVECSRDSPHFDRARFMAACGFEE